MELPFDNEGKRRDLKGRKGKAAEPSSSSSPARTIDKPSFDVFLSFRGEDTRKGITSHLYNALCQRGISTFLDSEELERGEKIEELFNYIEASKIFVPVLSKGFAASRWCLRETTKMVECGRLIIPIFFHVDPRDVRNQSGPFEAAFQQHESSNKVGKEDLRKWKHALRAVGEISGYILQNDTNGYEAPLIRKVVEQISRNLNNTARPMTEHLVGMDSHIDKMCSLLDLRDNEHLVGMDSHINKMCSLLDLTDNEVKMIGIMGMGGIGKTTIATVVYKMLLSDFVDSSFIKDVSEGFKTHNGGVAVQQRLIKDILRDEHSDIYSIKHGSSLIRKSFCSKRVMIILDNADSIEQLKALAGKRSWFGSGSRIIITSRDSRVLLEHGVKKEHIYWPEVLDYENSFKLFSSYAFHDVRPTKSEYVELSNEVVKVTGGLPLVLGVFGSHLWGRNLKEWKEFLQKLIQVLNKDVDGRLRICFDELEENVKQIFLDISCFLIGEQKEYATYMWEDSGLYPETAIAELQERSLININGHDEFEMHDLLRDMGRGIVAQEGEPWQWSRLRKLPDLLDSLAYKDKPKMAKGIVNAPDYMQGLLNRRTTYFSTQDLVDFSGLRLLHLYKLEFKGQFLGLPDSLKWLRLDACQFLNGLSSASNLNAISVLELIHVDDEDRILIKAFDALKVLHLEYSWMTRTPDFSKMNMICLRKLTVRNCKMLTEVDGSIGSLKSLVHLDLQDCYTLQRLPESLCTLNYLETLLLVGCSSLSSFPDKLGDMKSLKDLRAKYTGLRAVPDSIGDLSNLRTLCLNGNRHLEKLPDSMRTLDSLEELDLSFTKTVCHSAFSFLTSSMFSSGCSVRTLNLSHTNISGLPSSISNLAQLEELHLECCENLQSLPPLPSSLHVLNARGCNKLRNISDVSDLKSLKKLKLGRCGLLRDFCGLESIAHNLETLELSGPCGGLSGFSQLSPAFMTRVFKGAAFSSLKTFCVSASGQCGEPTDHHQPFWITFPKVGRGGKRPTSVTFSFLASSWLREEQELSVSIMEEDGHAVYQRTTGNLHGYISRAAIAEYSREGYYLRMQLSEPMSILNEIKRVLYGASLKVEYTSDCKINMKRKTVEPSSSSSPARTIDKPSFDVFLSFRGEDTRKGFTSHLYNALCQRGISTFVDSEELERGEKIEELFKYIEASKIFVSVLSKGFAASRWCLRETTKMVECGRLIIPIFFHVDPRDVRNQSGPFEAAFQQHESSNKVGKEDLRKWKHALRAVGEISGYILQNDTNGNEARLIGKVVKQISLKLNKTARPITEHLVGMDSHIEKMYRLLDLTDKEVKMIGIVGMGGVGKTTIATVVYDMLLSDFEDSSFISNVRENFKQHNGGVALQQRLIKDILKVEHPDIGDVEHGASLIKTRFRFKRVLVILDDADHIEQLEALAGKRDWFGPGSRIIITSRDSRVLLNHGVKEKHIYRPELLDDENSFKLFSSYAFRGVRPTKSEYVELLKEVVKVTGGLPLALGVFGSYLWGRNLKEWKEFLQKLIHVHDVDERLRISYDGLEEKVKQIFLDISCFFIGEQKEYATYMWEDCGLYPETAIAVLQERSLISINKDDKFEMHDSVRDMGRGIVAQQGEAWQRSRLTNLGDLRDSLAFKNKPRMAEGIVIKWQGYTKGLVNTPVVLSTQAFVDFSCLRLLHLYGCAFNGFLCLPERLKWLRLDSCKLSISVLQRMSKRLSGVSNLNAISVLELINVDDVDRILIWIELAFDALKVLHLESSGMTRTPNFSKMIWLRKLTLRNCVRLTEVDGSIGSLKSLVHLELRDCSKLRRLPDSICTLTSLETLILNGCNNLSSLPQKLGDMKSLRELRAE